MLSGPAVTVQQCLDLTELLRLCSSWHQSYRCARPFCILHVQLFFLFLLFRSQTALFSLSDVFPECSVGFCAFRSYSIFRMPLSDSPTWESDVSFAAGVTVKSAYRLCRDSQRLQITGELYFQHAHTTYYRHVCVISGRCDLYDFPRWHREVDDLRFHPGLWGIPATPASWGDKSGGRRNRLPSANNRTLSAF